MLGTLTAPDRQPTTHITLQQGVSTKVLACDLYITFDLSSQATAFVVNRGSYSAKSAFMLRRTGPLSCEIYYRVEKDFGFGSYQVQTTRGSYWRPDGASLSAPSDALEIRSDEMLSTTRAHGGPATGQSDNGQHGRSGRITQSADRGAEDLTEQRQRALVGAHQELQPAGRRQGDTERLRRSPAAARVPAAPYRRA